jgi:ferredoxin
MLHHGDHDAVAGAEESACKAGCRQQGAYMELLVKADGQTRRLQVKKNENLMKVLLQNGLDISHPCRGRGKCGKCKVRVTDWDGASETGTGRDANDANDAKKAKDKLACLVSVDRPLAVDVKANWQTKDTKGARGSKALDETKRTPANPPFVRTCVSVGNKPFQPGESLWSRLLATASEADRKALKRAMPQVLPLLPEVFADASEQVTIVRAGTRLVGLQAADVSGTRCVAAVLASGKTLSGVLVALEDEGTHAVCRLPLTGKASAQGLANLLDTLCRRAGVPMTEISCLVLAGESKCLFQIAGLEELLPLNGGQVPVCLEEQFLPASRVGLALQPLAGIWIPTMVSLGEGVHPALDDLAPAWVPLVARWIDETGDEAQQPGRQREANRLAALLGCLWHASTRKQLRKQVKRLRRSQPA